MRIGDFGDKGFDPKFYTYTIIAARKSGRYGKTGKEEERYGEFSGGVCQYIGKICE